VIKPRFASRRKAVTVAIATRCESGAVLIVDKNIVLGDGSKTIGRKYYWRYVGGGCDTVTLVSATDDGVAAECLANQILEAIVKNPPASPRGMVDEACKQMQEWHSSYAPSSAPSLNYLMIASCHKQQELYLLQPPRSFLPKHSFAIGLGAREAQPILEKLISGSDLYRPDAALMFLTYMAKRAEAEEAFVGGGFDAFYVPMNRPPKEIDSYDMLLAAETILSVDGAVALVLQLLMSLESPEELEKTSASVCGYVAALASQLAKTNLFPSLKRSVSQKSEPEQ
jgi:20S proteasome alpha/beta subunit